MADLPTPFIWADDIFDSDTIQQGAFEAGLSDCDWTSDRLNAVLYMTTSWLAQAIECIPPDISTVDAGEVCERYFLNVDGAAIPLGVKTARTFSQREVGAAQQFANLATGADFLVQEMAFDIPCEGWSRYSATLLLQVRNNSTGLDPTVSGAQNEAEYQVRLFIDDGSGPQPASREIWNPFGVFKSTVSADIGPQQSQSLAPGSYTLSLRIEVSNGADLTFDVLQSAIAVEQFH